MGEILKLIQSEKHVLAATIFLGFFIAAFIIDFTTRRILLRLTRKTRTTLDDEIVDALQRPVFFTVLVIGISQALTALGIPESVEKWTSKVLITLAVLLWTGAGMKMTKSILSLLARRAGDKGLVQFQTLPLFEITLKTILFGGAAYGMLLAWNVDVTAWLASAGILGIAIGFAAKDTLANLFSGIFILADSPYKIGDFIVLDTGERGMVTDIGIRSTRILTRDDLQIIIPNAVIGNAKITNESSGRHVMRRVRVNVSVAYGSDIDKVREVLMDIAANSKYLVSEPEPRVRFRLLGESSLDFQLMGWINEPVERGRSLDELNTAIYKRFTEEKIQIPFPQREVHLREKS